MLTAAVGLQPKQQETTSRDEMLKNFFYRQRGALKVTLQRYRYDRMEEELWYTTEKRLYTALINVCVTALMGSQHSSDGSQVVFMPKTWPKRN